MKIFITGGSGFVGSAIIRKMSQNHEVYAMARSDSSAKKVREAGAIPVKCQLNAVKPADLQKADWVIHSAAFVEPWGERSAFWRANVEGTRQLIEAAKKAGVKKFLLIGTEAALFHGQDMINVDETYPYAFNSPFLYSETKAHAEKLTLEANEPGGMQTVSIRPRMVWGPNDTTIFANLVEMVDRGAFKWLDHGRAMTSTTHIDNLVHGVELGLEKGRGGEAYFVTDDEDLTMKKFITGLLETAGRTPGKGNVPGWFARAAAGGMEFFWKAFGIKKKPPLPRFNAAVMSRACTINISKAKQELGYAPVKSLSEGMEELRRLNAAGRSNDA